MLALNPNLLTFRLLLKDPLLLVTSSLGEEERQDVRVGVTR